MPAERMSFPLNAAVTKFCSPPEPAAFAVVCSPPAVALPMLPAAVPTFPAISALRVKAAVSGASGSSSDAGESGASSGGRSIDNAVSTPKRISLTAVSSSAVWVCTALPSATGTYFSADSTPNLSTFSRYFKTRAALSSAAVAMPTGAFTTAIATG